MPKAVYSCVLDPKPKYVRQLATWVTTLVALGGVERGDLFVHVLDSDGAPEATAFLTAQGVPFAPAARFGDGTFCNKVAQLRSPQLRRHEYVVLSDTDVAFAAPLDPWIGVGRIAARPVDGPNPPLALLEEVYRRAGFSAFPERVPCGHARALTFANNCNGGITILRTDAIDAIGPRWEQWTLWVLEQSALLGPHLGHADQLGFGLALWDLGETVVLLPPAANFPVHFGPHRYALDVEPPAALHYHDKVDAGGALRPLGIAAVDERIARVNDVLTAAERTRVLPALVEVESIFGPMLAYPDDVVTQQMERFGAHTRPELAFLLSTVRDGDRIFDLGAHIGTFAIPLARKAGPAGRVVAIEAVREFWLVAVENVARNGLSGRVDLRCALLAPSGRLEAVRDRTNTGATFFQTSDDVWTADAVTIDGLAADTFVPDVIKIDVEGLETWALTTSAVVRERKPVIYAEISARQSARAGTSIGELSDVLRGLGYRLFRNAGTRNAAHDAFVPEELDGLPDDRPLYDVLAIHGGDERLAGVTALLPR